MINTLKATLRRQYDGILIIAQITIFITLVYDLLLLYGFCAHTRARARARTHTHTHTHNIYTDNVFQYYETLMFQTNPLSAKYLHNTLIYETVDRISDGNSIK